MPRVSLISLGCARNDVDSEELAGRLADAEFELVDEGEPCDIVVVNTCGFIESARKDSIDVILEAADTSGGRVVAVGCMAERYGAELAAELPEAAAVLGFDDYPVIAERLRAVLSGESLTAHAPRDRRTLLPISPVQRPAAVGDLSLPGHAWLPTRQRRDSGPVASLKIASGCDRRCSFCAIPRFRGAFVSRSPEEILAEAAWLAAQGAREVLLVSENSTSYGKDLGDIRALERLLPQVSAVDGIDRVRVSYLQPAEMRPSLIEALAGPGIAPYADLSFQHASPDVLRRMRRFGGIDDFLALIASIRQVIPHAGIRSNVIVGFPGETDRDLEMLEEFLVAAELDAVGVFGYSPEEDTEALHLANALPPAEVRRRVERVATLVDDLVVDRAEHRVGERIEVLVLDRGEGAAGHQGPEDGRTHVRPDIPIGSLVVATVTSTDGVDMVAEVI